MQSLIYMTSVFGMYYEGYSEFNGEPVLSILILFTILVTYSCFFSKANINVTRGGGLILFSQRM